MIGIVSFKIPVENGENCEMSNETIFARICIGESLHFSDNLFK